MGEVQVTHTTEHLSVWAVVFFMMGGVSSMVGGVSLMMSGVSSMMGGVSQALTRKVSLSADGRSILSRPIADGQKGNVTGNTCFVSMRRA